MQRTLKFVRHLPSFGWKPTVVTVREPHYWMRDATLLAEVPPEVSVVRTGGVRAIDVLRHLGLRSAVEEPNGVRSGTVHHALRRIAGWLLVPDPYVGWVARATRAAREVLRDGGALVTTSSPDSAHLVGLRLKARGIPWLADFRDPWVRRMSFSPPTAVHRLIHERLEARVIRAADRITVTSDATREDFLRRYPDLDPARIAIVPNGYDEEDFPAVAPPLAEKFTLLHMGQLNPERPVGPLLDHVEAFLRARPAARERVEILLVGPRYREDEEEVARRALTGVVRFRDAVAHREAVATLFTAHLLLLVEQESDRGGLILPGKTFEYLRAARPILGILPHGAAWDLITRLRAGRCALPSEPASGAAVMAEAWDRFAAGGPWPPAGGAPEPEVACFERRALARRFAELLEETLPLAARR